MAIKLTDITDIIRSKNAGPYELTFDIMFKTDEWYERVAKADVINTALIADLYKIPVTDVLGIIDFVPAKAIKVTIRRPIASGALGETDVYGAQQHAPLLGLVFAV
ncbi:MAG: DUF4387 domain-containing protein [Oscillospiraceae bacterium]|nr:DUF4387 domain-containing protein [Oscillospiraceae bacterium]